MSTEQTTDIAVEVLEEILKGQLSEKDWVEYEALPEENKKVYLDANREALVNIKNAIDAGQPLPKTTFEVQPFTRLSQSHLWTLMSNYYDSTGPNSWTEYKVPYFITSNSYIGNTYANLLSNYIKDYTVNNVIADNEKIYILELGSGSGKFAFHMLKSIVELMDTNPDLGKICYVMSDFTDSNINFWAKHKSFQQFIDLGILDFAKFNIYTDNSITLNISGEVLSAGSVVHPLIVIANYIFDTMACDLFRVHNGVLMEGQLSLRSSENEKNPNDPAIFTRMDNVFRYEPYYPTETQRQIEYYENPLHNSILKWYYSYFSDDSRSAVGGTVLFPVTVLNCLDRLAGIADNKLVVLSGDKGSSHADTFSGLNDPHIAVHGSVSLMANYHAVGLWFNAHDGCYYHHDYSDSSLRISCFIMSNGDIDTSNIKNTKNINKINQAEYTMFTGAYNKYVRDLNPSDYHHLHRYLTGKLKDSQTPEDFETVLALLKMTNYDADTFFLVKDYINTNLDKIHVNLCKDFFRVMRKLWDNYYPLNANRDLAFEYGCILFKIKKYSKAIEFYEHSRLYNGDNANTLFNIALCYKELNIPDNSLVYAKMALKADPSYDKAKVLLSVLDNDITAEKLLDMI